MKIYFLADIFLYSKTGIYRYSKEIVSAILADPKVDLEFISNGETKNWKLEKELKETFGSQIHLYRKLKILNRIINLKLNYGFFDRIFEKYKQKRNEDPKNLHKFILEFTRIPRNLELIISNIFGPFISRFLMRNFSFFPEKSVLFSPYQTFNLSKKILSNCTVVTTVHDIIPLIHPEYFEKNHYFEKKIFKPLEYSNLVLTVSDNTKNDLLEKATFLERTKVKTVKIAASSHFKPSNNSSDLARIKNKYKIPLDSDYIFTVCTIEPRKNHIRLIKAWGKIYKELDLAFPHLVISGRKGWGNEVDSIFRNDQNLSKSIIFTDYVLDEDLPILYSGALFSIYPSMYEGFGLPVLESMMCKTFCLTSNISSMPELAGYDVPLVNPLSVDDIAEKIILLSNNKELLNDLNEKQYERSKLFNWDKTYKNTIHLISEIV